MSFATKQLTFKGQVTWLYGVWVSFSDSDSQGSLGQFLVEFWVGFWVFVNELHVHIHSHSEMNVKCTRRGKPHKFTTHGCINFIMLAGQADRLAKILDLY